MDDLKISHLYLKEPVPDVWLSIPFFVSKKIAGGKLYLLNGLSHIAKTQDFIDSMVDRMRLTPISFSVSYDPENFAWLSPKGYVYYGPREDPNESNSEPLMILPVKTRQMDESERTVAVAVNVYEMLSAEHLKKAQDLFVLNSRLPGLQWRQSREIRKQFVTEGE